MSVPQPTITPPSTAFKARAVESKPPGFPSTGHVSKSKRNNQTACVAGRLAIAEMTPNRTVTPLAICNQTDDIDFFKILPT
jgi:hypothetical protein